MRKTVRVNTTLNATGAAFVILVASGAVLGCSDSTPRGMTPPGADSGTMTPPGTVMMPGEVPNDVPLPPMRMTTSSLLDEALAACQRRTAEAERAVITGCTFSPTTVPVLESIADLHAEAIETRPLPGRGLEAFALPPGEITLEGDAIEMLPCTTNPFCMPGAPCSSMNAFALTNLLTTLDPLLASFAEGAAFWGTLVDAAGGDPEMVDESALFAGLGTIYNAHANGRGYATIDAATVASMLAEDDFVNEMWTGVTAFLVMHEIGHADLGHGLINHTAAVGAQQALMAEGRMLSAEEAAQLRAELRTLKVFTETQADIYAASLLRELGYSSDGPVVLFTAAMSAYILATGSCDGATTQDELFDCALMNDPNAAHPPLDVRATVLHRIIDEGEDLTGVLEEITPP